MDEQPDSLFRRLRPVDADALGALFERNDVPAVTDLFCPFPLTRATAHQLLRDGCKDLFFGLFHGGQLTAFSMLRGFDEGYAIPSFGLLVDRPQQRRGYGRALLRHTCRYADRAAVARVRLTVFLDNPGARALYEAEGFAAEAEGVRHGRPHAVMFRPARAAAVPVYASTSCLRAGEPLPERARRWADAGLLHLECSFYPGLDAGALREAAACAAAMMLHSYVPLEGEDFCFNLASPSPELRRRCIRFARERLHLSRDLGARHYAVHAGFAADPEGRDACGFLFPAVTPAQLRESEQVFADAIAELAAEARTAGVTLLVENNVMIPASRGKLLLVSPSDFARSRTLFEATGARVLLDLGHAKVSARTEGDAWEPAVFSALAPLIAGLHLHDNDGRADQHLPAGLSPAVRALPGLFSPDFVTLEGRFAAIGPLQQDVIATEEVFNGQPR